MLNEIENYVAKVADGVVQQQMLTFTSYDAAQRHLEGKRSELRQTIQQGQKLLMKGLMYFVEMKCDFVSKTSSDLLKYLDDEEKFSEIIESQIIQNDNALPLFMEAAEHFLDCGDVDKEQCVITVLMGLFPLHPQPYVYLGMLVWRQEGIAAAENFYTKVVKEIEDPALDYFAADCFYKRGGINKAKEILQRALSNTDMSPVMYSDLKREILALLEKC